MTGEALADRYGIDSDSAAVLDRYGFDGDTFDELRGRLAGRTSAQSGLLAENRLSGRVEAPDAGDLAVLAPLGSGERERLDAVGRKAIAQGQVGVVLLAGGMATRFGGGVKALAEVLDGLTFVGAKLADLRRLAGELGCEIPMTLMTSFQSDVVLKEWASAAGSATGGERHAVPVTVAPQCVSLRLRPDGELYRDAGGVVSLYAPGHGDAPWAMRRSGVLDAFAAAGGRHLYVTNVDNAAATLDPAVIGAHVANARLLTCEVVSGGASGGAPWRVEGHLQIVESFRLPAGIDPVAAGAANTNSLVADVEVFARDCPLTWFEVRKQVDGVEVAQFERLIGELSAFTETTMLLVERDGPDGRFQPVKDPAELTVRRPEIVRILTGRGISLSEPERARS